MPIYTYECEKGHRWDEVRTIEGSETSAEPCETCVEGSSDPTQVRTFIELDPDTWRRDGWFGKKVPSSGVTPIFRGPGWTPKFYPNRGK